MPSAPCLLPELTGGQVPELADVREAVAGVLGDLVAAGPHRVVVAARREAGTLSGFGTTPVLPTRTPPVLGSSTATSSAPGSAALPDGPGRPDSSGWAHELGALLLARHGWRGAVEPVASTDTVAGALACAASESDPATRTAVLVLADGSATRGPRAPGGADPRGEDLDAQLLADLRAGRVVTPSEADAAAVGCRGLPGLTMFTALRVGVSATVDPTASPDVDVRYAGAPLGVGYLVAVRLARAT